jgi:hypothetical protein
MDVTYLTRYPLTCCSNGFNRLIKYKVPEGYPVLGKTTIYDASQNIDLETVPLNGVFLLKTLVLWIDPFMRGKSTFGVNYASRFLIITFQ